MRAMINHSPIKKGTMHVLLRTIYSTQIQMVNNRYRKADTVFWDHDNHVNSF